MIIDLGNGLIQELDNVLLFTTLKDIDIRFKYINYSIKKEKYKDIAKSIVLTIDNKILYASVTPQTIEYRNQNTDIYKFKRRSIMYELLNIGYNNRVSLNRVEAIVNYESAPIKRLVNVLKDDNKVIDATEGRRTRSLIITTEDIVILSAFEASTLISRIEELENLFVHIGYGNFISKEYIISIVDHNSLPIKRLVTSNAKLNKTFDLTQGRSTRSLIVTSSNKTIKSATTLKTLEKFYNKKKPL